MRRLDWNRWNLVKEELAREWPGIPEVDLDWIQADMDRLVAVIQLHYGFTTEEAQERVVDFLDRVRA